MNSYTNIYRQPFSPLVIRDLLAECDITQNEMAVAVGVNKEILRLVITRGYMPVYKRWLRQRIEEYILANALTAAWLQAKKLKLPDIWTAAHNSAPGMRPAGHGRRVYRYRTPEGSIDTPQRGVRELKGFSLVWRIQREKEEIFMQSRLEILAEFGYRKDPFRSFFMETADSMRIKRLLKMAIDSSAMVSIVATWGVGKTTSLDIAFREMDAHVIRLVTADKERVVVSDIEKGLILGLSKEPCKRTKEVRARQIRRIVGEAAKERPVILVLEEAHRMHAQTLRALKTLREMEWMGQSPLFTVCMIGQYDPMRKRGVDEVRLRTDSVQMKGLTGSEVKEYIRNTVGKSFDDDATEAISRLNDARNFLELQQILMNVMGKALEYGQQKVTALEVYELYGGGLKEVLKRTNITLSDLKKSTGISKSTLSMVTNDKTGTLTDEKFSGTRQAIASVLREKAGKQPQLKAVNHGE